MSGGFVRAARASDADGLAVVQVESWRAAFAALVPEEVISELTSESALAQWALRWGEAISTPPTSRHRVHVAVAKPGDPEILGFAAAGPATDEDLWPRTDGELYELHVLPSAAGEGHDQRLLNAVADTFAEDGFSTGYTWVLSGDEVRLDFLKAAGWAPDGSRSNLDMGVKVAVERLHTRVGSAGG
jgi:ribosomal protein S18 acetylase RimI-like enzyme